ncbi:AT-hook motif nuclear-localized protein 10 [Abeliophyllum distichum]|uniref:AT-hook motif nuclear-localized protein n=1 Tax=Abeliophyllum distichum TaxID=126358 RepID=A0ABD1RXF0_9LAMI
MEADMQANSSQDERSWVLALEKLNGEVPRPCRPRILGRRALNLSKDLASTDEKKGFKVQIFTINAGEEIGGKILSHFDELKNCDWSGHILRRGNILSATGQISRATINFQGSDTSFEGSYEIIKLLGFYSIPKDGEVELIDNLKLTFATVDGSVYGGPMMGELIACSTIQVCFALT